jgi:long-chain acyl-CoA synthetase
VLPLHHTFEFSAGFLMPLMHGASITYLEEIDADSLSAALEEAGITGMVGVPALWQLLERKIYKNISDKGILLERAFEAVSTATARCATSWAPAWARSRSTRCTRSSAPGCGC